ncbi:MAG: AMP-binding protein [Deltaproteobacteria bacterium]|nr:AMP-binding protein [Deltaproteobacteria bacterium]
MAKVVLAMLLERFAPKKVYCLIRPHRSKTAHERLLDEVIGCEMMGPLAKRFGPSFEAYVADRVAAVAGDVSKPDLGVDREMREVLKAELDLVINSAGLVSFTPPLDDALEVNTIGAREAARFTRACAHAKLVHISTCFVAGRRSGHVREDEPISGFFPKQKELKGVTFDVEREIRDLERLARQVKERTDDAALEARFLEEAKARLAEDGRDAKPRTLKAAITNARRRWVSEELVRLGSERSEQWGWPNVYTYTKSLGEQSIAAIEGLDWAIVRPAIVESALEYPFPGWNEGMNTSAPLSYLGIHGHVIYPAPEDLVLDVVPVDSVASAILAAGAALFLGETKKIYQVAAGDTNPCSMGRVVTLVGLYRRRKLKKEESAGDISWLRARLGERVGPLPLTRSRYERFGAPALSKAAKSARKLLDNMDPERYGPFGALVKTARTRVKDVGSDLEKVTGAFDLFMPFIWEHRYVFRTHNTRALFARMSEADRALLPYGIESIDWRTYWLEIHLPGLEEWVFPKLDNSPRKKVTIPHGWHDLAEMFESRTEEHARRVAFRILREGDVADSYSYKDVRRAAEAVARYLGELGVGPKDRVLLSSESRPEWGIAYFGIILAGATAVPVDTELSAAEIANLARAAKVKAAIASDSVRRKLGEANGEAGFDAAIVGFLELFKNADVDVPFTPKKRSPDDLASIIFTSGTTGRPKGVMLTDKNFTALVSRMSALFHLGATDSLLSVLPLHHTFEFSAGLLLPFSSGSSITYLEDRTPELLARAFEETPVTSMVGVPAVWEALHRKIMREVAAHGRVAETLVRGLMALNRLLRDNSPWNLGRFVFRPMHDALGGRVRFMVSGGAPLSPALFKDLRGLGFNVHEGYGLTEAAPVLAVGWPRERAPAGSVGQPLPGIELRIDRPDSSGLGEIIARGPTIMAGYLDDPAATQLTLGDGWLHTGDQGRLDEDGNLFIVGRKKDVIIESSGKNVYPDELEELYSGSKLVKELSVVGVPIDGGTGERVAALVVPDYEAVAAEGLAPDEVREKVREHFRDVGSKQPHWRRIKVLHFWEKDLPRTSTRKIQRRFVRDQITRLERALRTARDGVDWTSSNRTQSGVLRTLASIAQRRPEELQNDMRVGDLGLDSLMQLELVSALESEFPRARISQDELQAVETISDLVELASRDRSNKSDPAEEVGQKEERPVEVPAPLRSLGKSFLGLGQRFTYERLFDVRVEGQGNVPANRNFIVASNHSSHLDMGLVKHALGELGDGLVTLAAKDYFFDDPVRRIYFENFTNLLPMDRHGSLKKSMRLASEALRGGSSLLIFPEGTRSREGEMARFRPAIGYLALSEGIDVVPMFLGGTHDALPVGASVPKGRKLFVKIGPPILVEELAAASKGWPRSLVYKKLALDVEHAVRALGGLPPPPDDEVALDEEERAIAESKADDDDRTLGESTADTEDRIEP